MFLNRPPRGTVGILDYLTFCGKVYVLDITHFVTEEAIPVYNIYQYTDELYKIVRFNRSHSMICGHVRKEEQKHYDKKLDASLSRSRRVVLELALCNYWEYFCTFTIAASNYDRFNLDSWHKDFSQWLRDQRKKLRKLGKDCDIQYLIVPEQHKDGAWHMHGLFRGIRDFLIPFSKFDMWGWDVPRKLVDDGYYCWFDYWLKFGFNSMARIQNPVAVGFYIAKYVTKAMSDTVSNDSGIGLGSHLYYPSRGLNHPVKHGSVYHRTQYLDKWLSQHYDFCSTGMVSGSSDADWTFAMQYMPCDDLNAISFSDPDAFNPEADDFYEGIQLNFY